MSYRNLEFVYCVETGTQEAYQDKYILLSVAKFQSKTRTLILILSNGVQ